MSERLIEILARTDVEALRPHVGSPTIALLELMGSPASGPRGLAELIVRQTGAAEALRTKDVRDIVLAALDPNEREDLCRVLGHPRGDTARTLKGAQFDRIASHLELLFGWLAVPFETEDLRDEEETRQAPPAHKLNDHQRSAFRDLRRRLDESGSATLLHMPVGAGKLRIVATALVDLYRSEPDGRIVLWLAHDPALCSQAFDELESAWRMLGSRDVTLYRHYGRHHARDLDEVEDGIVVADARYLARNGDATALARLGGRARAVVLNETQQADAAAYRRVMEALGPSRTYALIGLSAAPGAAIRSTGRDAALGGLFPTSRITLPAADPISFLRTEGWLGHVTFEELRCQTGVPLPLEEGDLDVEADALRALADDPARNTCILDRIRDEVEGGANLVLFATSGSQARMFVGLLGLHGIRAVAVTDDMPRDRQQQGMLEYQNRDSAQVLCTYGIFVPGSMVRKTTVALIARPTTSPMLYSHMVGRLAGGRAEESCASLKVVTLTDDVPGFRDLVAHFPTWDDL